MARRWVVGAALLLSVKAAPLGFCKFPFGSAANAGANAADAK
jgi:hypothetical protein